MNKNLRVLVTGAKGQLGKELKKRATNVSTQFFFTDIDDLDLSDYGALENRINDVLPNIIINCAAYTAVDLAETEQDKCMRGNVEVVKNLATIATKRGIKIIHISSDYVFDGRSFQPYNEECETNPISFYGYTKLLGEQELIKSKCDGIVIRTSWLYSNEGNNFFNTIKRLGSERSEISIVFDQIGTPTFAGDLADAILSIIPQMNTFFGLQIYHYSNEGVCSWYDFATAIISGLKLKTTVYPIHSQEYPTLAQRPFYSVLDKAKIKNDFGLQINHWQKTLQLFMGKNG